MINEHRIETWNELNDHLFDETWNPGIGRFRSTFAYRGVADQSFRLSTSLQRLGKPYPNLERNLIKQFQKYAHRDVVEHGDGEWHWLSVAQHHGLPTRLLDWTYSPFIALHFATVDLENYAGLDCAVWKVDFSQVHQLLQKKQTASLDKLGARIFSTKALEETIRTIDELTSLSANSYEVAVFFEPPAIDDRIANQFAYFSALSNPRLDFDQWLKTDAVNAAVEATKIIIPDALKWEIRDKLDQSNINERVLMPGLDGLCSWLKRHYKPIDRRTP